MAFFYLYRKKYYLIGKFKYITFSLSETLCSDCVLPIAFSVTREALSDTQPKPLPLFRR